MRSLYVNILLFILCIVLPVNAKVYKVEDVPMVHLADRTRYVSNPDGILSQGTVASIDSLLFALEEKTGIQALVAVLTGIEGGDCFDFAYRLGKENGIGQKGRDNGFVVLLSTDERCIQFATGYGLEGVLPDAICKRIQQRYMVEHFGRGDWDTGMLEGMRAVCGHLDGSMDNVAGEDDDTAAILVFMGIIALAVLFFAWLAWYNNRCPMCKKHKIQRVDSRVVGHEGYYSIVETTYRCQNCGHTFTRTDHTYDNNGRGPRGGGMIIGGGFGRGGFGGGGFGGGSFGGGRFGGGGAGSRF